MRFINFQAPSFSFLQSTGIIARFIRILGSGYLTTAIHCCAQECLISLISVFPLDYSYIMYGHAFMLNVSVLSIDKLETRVKN